MKNKRIMMISVGRSGVKITQNIKAMSNKPLTFFDVIEKFEQKRFEEALKNIDIVLIISSLGSSSSAKFGTRLLKIAKQGNIYTIGVFTKPFRFEGKNRCNNTDMIYHHIKSWIDLPFVIDNNSFIPIIENSSISEGFDYINRFLAHMILGIIDGT